MALPGPGVALSLNDIKGEFGGPSSPSLADYYAGGSYVPSGTSGSYGAVPTSGTISIQNFYGTSAAFSLTMDVGYYYYYDPEGGGLWYELAGFSDTYIGSISPTTFPYAGGVTITQLSWEYDYPDYYGPDNKIFFTVGADVPNSGWSSVNINGSVYYRSSAAYINYGSGFTEWFWDTGSSRDNPFGFGGTITCTFYP